jgi:antitoxin MazE
MQTQVQKWGNSLGVRIPRDIADKLCIKNGVMVSLEISDHNIIIAPVTSELDLLLDNITDANRHNEELKDDNILGNELW